MSTAAVAGEYISAEELKATMELSGTMFADNDVAAAVAAASRAVDEACQRKFWTDGEQADRYYTPQTAWQIVIDDLAAVSAIDLDMDGDGDYETTYAQGTDFLFEPPNAVADSQPYTGMRLMPRNTRGFPYWYPQSVKIRGIWGWEVTPAQIKSATTITASRLLKRMREAPFGVVSIGIDVGAVARIATHDPDVRTLLSPFMRERPYK